MVTGPRHQRAGPARRPLFTTANIVKTTGVLSLAVVAGVLLSGGTFAYLNASDALPSATIKAGSALLTTTGSPVALTGLYPGATQSAVFTINNTGDVPLILNVSGLTAPTVDSPGVSAALTVRVDVTTPGAGCATLPVTPGWQSTFAASPPTVNAPVSLATTVAPGASTTLCLSASLALTAANSAQGHVTNSFAVTIGGVQS